MKKFILVSFFLPLTLSFLTIPFFAAEKRFSDSVNVRKLLFLNDNNWDSLVNKKSSFFNDDFGLVVVNRPPKFFDKLFFENDILLNIKNWNDKKTILSSYKLSQKGNNYQLYETSSKNLDITKKILEMIGFSDFDYFMIFYKKDQMLEQKKVVIDENFSETFTYGKISYLFNHNKELLEVKIYYQDNNNSYLYFDSLKAGKFDVYLFGKIYKRNLTHNLKFDSLKILDLNTILSLIKENHLENETLIEKNDKSLKEEFINKIVKQSLKYNYVDDGARNELGEFVYISNGLAQKESKIGFNCSGFVKDVVDNYIRYKKGDFKWLTIEELSERRTFERKSSSYTFYDRQLDPYFGLDWVKNIVEKINYQFNMVEEKSEIYTYDKYSNIYENEEYDFDDLKEILFRAGQSDNNYFYIVVFNKFRALPPSVPSYYHMAIVLTYFENNHFYTRVFESGEETSFSNLVKLHSNEKVVIFRVPIFEL